MNKDIEYFGYKALIEFWFGLFWLIQLVVKPRSRLRPVIISKTLIFLI